MGHSSTSSLSHVVFSTKERRRTIDAELQGRLWPYLGGIARENKMKARAVGGAADHVQIAALAAVDAGHRQGRAAR
jgi:hypothetical protein